MKLYKLIQKTPFFLSVSHWITKKDNPIKGSNNSRSAVIIPLLLMQYGSLKEKLKSFKIVRTALLTSLKEMRRSAKEIRKNPNTGKNNIEADDLVELEKFINSLGISKIGYTKVNPNFIFKRFEILYENSIVVAMEMDRDIMKTNPSDTSTKEIWHTYSHLGISVNKIAAFLRGKGFNCHASPAVGGDIMSVPVAQDAGLGVVGKNGILITPEYGPSQRLASIFVDIENLPLKKIEDNEHLWIRDFCETCNLCVHSCPGKAIYEQTKILEDGYPQFIDREKCAPEFSKNCSKCISSCPFIMGHYKQIKKTFERDEKKEKHG